MAFVTHDELQIRSFHIFLGVGTGRPFASVGVTLTTADYREAEFLPNVCDLSRVSRCVICLVCVLCHVILCIIRLLLPSP